MGLLIHYDYFLWLVKEQNGEYFKTTKMPLAVWTLKTGSTAEVTGSIPRLQGRTDAGLSMRRTGSVRALPACPRVTTQPGREGTCYRPKLNMSPHQGHYEFRASVFLELLLQSGQGDRVHKTIKKVRKTKSKVFSS